MFELIFIRVAITRLYFFNLSRVRLNDDKMILVPVGDAGEGYNVLR